MESTLSKLAASMWWPMAISGYYSVKPYIPWALRMAVRSYLARRILRQSTHIWPILEPAGKPPAGWSGWPDGKRFALVLTHDVEGAHGLGRCVDTAELEAELGFRSSFNFIPAGPYETPLELRNYLSRRGFEVGVHDLRHDGKLYKSRQAFQSHAQAINRFLQAWDAKGFRSGFMHHNLEWLQDLNISYDGSTFDVDPFEPQPDGVSTIFPFIVKHRITRRDYVELPYTLAQDSTLFFLLKERTIDYWKRKLDWIVERGGMALINTHPDYMCFKGYPALGQYPASCYAEFLKYVQTEYAGEYWSALPQDVATYVRQQSNSPQRLVGSAVRQEPSFSGVAVVALNALQTMCESALALERYVT